MNKREFTDQLRAKLHGLPEQELEERLAFYREMIDDRVEEGLSEEEAVSEIGSVEEIAAQIIADVPLARLAKERLRPKKQPATWVILLLVLGSPLWLPLLIAAAAVVLSLYASLWAVLISLWSAFAAIVGSAVGGALGGAVLAAVGHGMTGLGLFGAALVCAGVSIFAFQGCKALTLATLHMTRAAVHGTKHRLIKGGMNRE